MRYPTTDDHYGPSGQPLNPWLSVWTRPRTTIRYILATNPSYGFWPIIIAYGVVSFLQTAEGKGLGIHFDSLTPILIAAIFLGPPLVLVGVYISGWILELTGRRLKGRATQHDLRIASLWSYLPMIAAGLMYWPRIAIFGTDLFNQKESPLDKGGLSANLAALEYADLTALIIAAVWTIILSSHMIAQVQGYNSAWRGFTNLLLPTFYFMLLLLVVFILAVIAKFIITGSLQ